MVKTFSLLILAGLLASCGNDTCSNFESAVQDPSVAQELEHWVDGKFQQGLLSPKVRRDGKIRRPGSYLVDIDFELDRFGLEAGTEARVSVGSEGEVVAVFFGSRAMQGVLVTLPDANFLEYVIDSSRLVTPRVSTVCVKAD